MKALPPYSSLFDPRSRFNGQPCRQSYRQTVLSTSSVPSVIWIPDSPRRRGGLETPLALRVEVFGGDARSGRGGLIEYWLEAEVTTTTPAPALAPLSISLLRVVSEPEPVEPCWRLPGQHQRCGGRSGKAEPETRQYHPRQGGIAVGLKLKKQPSCCDFPWMIRGASCREYLDSPEPGSAGNLSVSGLPGRLIAFNSVLSWRQSAGK